MRSAIVGAEYVLRWLPRGTHQWDKFVTPDELAHQLSRNKLGNHRASPAWSTIRSPIKWTLSSDMDVNYMVVAEGVPRFCSACPRLARSSNPVENNHRGCLGQRIE